MVPDYLKERVTGALGKKPLALYSLTLGGASLLGGDWVWFLAFYPITTIGLGYHPNTSNWMAIGVLLVVGLNKFANALPWS